MRALVAAGVLLLSACSAAQDAVDAEVRQTAEQVINTVVERNFPGVNAAPVSNCVVDNATTGEILTVAKAAVTGIDEETVTTVLDIAKRRDTLECIARNGIALLG
ncbi:MAG: succinate dehydrogenase [Pseudomonadota bacterium]